MRGFYFRTFDLCRKLEFLAEENHWGLTKLEVFDKNVYNFHFLTFFELLFGGQDYWCNWFLLLF